MPTHRLMSTHRCWPCPCGTGDPHCGANCLEATATVQAERDTLLAKLRAVEALPAVGTLRGEPVVSFRALRRILDVS